MWKFSVGRLPLYCPHGAIRAKKNDHQGTNPSLPQFLMLPNAMVLALLLRQPMIPSDSQPTKDQRPQAHLTNAAKGAGPSTPPVAAYPMGISAEAQPAVAVLVESCGQVA